MTSMASTADYDGQRRPVIDIDDETVDAGSGDNASGAGTDDDDSDGTSEPGDTGGLARELRLALGGELTRVGEYGRCLVLLGEAELLARALHDRARLGTEANGRERDIADVDNGIVGRPGPRTDRHGRHKCEHDHRQCPVPSTPARRHRAQTLAHRDHHSKRHR